jgi:hypothetical protein
MKGEKKKMPEKTLRGHHVKNLALAINISIFDPFQNRRALSYIIDGDPNDMVRIVAGCEDGVCKDCKEFEYENYSKCRASHQTPTAIQEMIDEDTWAAGLFGVKIGEKYITQDLIKKLSSKKLLINAVFGYCLGYNRKL